MITSPMYAYLYSADTHS